MKYPYQVHLIDVESDPGQVAEKEQKSRKPGKPSISIAEDWELKIKPKSKWQYYLLPCQPLVGGDHVLPVAQKCEDKYSEEGEETFKER